MLTADEYERLAQALYEDGRGARQLATMEPLRSQDPKTKRNELMGESERLFARAALMRLTAEVLRIEDRGARAGRVVREFPALYEADATFDIDAWAEACGVHALVATPPCTPHSVARGRDALD